MALPDGTLLCRVPFTPAHPAIVLPLLRRGRPWIDPVALVAGSMAPDFEYFLRARMDGRISHTLIGLLTFDLPVGLVLALLFRRLVGPALELALPTSLTVRMRGAFPERPKPRRGNAWAAAVGGTLLGAASHLFWDAFTHRTGFFVQHIPALAATFNAPALGEVAVYRVLQHTSTLVGFVAIAWVLQRWPKAVRSPATPKARARVAFVVIPLVFSAIGVVARAYAEGGWRIRDYGHYAAALCSGLIVGVIVASIVVYWKDIRPARTT